MASAVKLQAVPNLPTPRDLSDEAAEAYQLEVATARHMMGSLLIGSDPTIVFREVRETDLEDVQCRFVFKVAKNMHAIGVPLSTVSVLAFVASEGLVPAGGRRNKLASYLADLASDAPIGAFTPYLVGQVLEHSARRAAVYAAERISGAAESGSMDDYRTVVTGELRALLNGLDRVTAYSGVSQ